MRLVFVHGRSQGDRDPVELEERWEAAFDEGLRSAGLTRPDGLDVELPFYGRTLDDLVEQLEAPLVADVTERGAAQDDAEAAFRGEFLAEIAAAHGITDAQIEEEYEGDVRERGPLNWKWVHAVVKALDRNKHLGDLALDSFTRDVFVYLTYAGVRRRIDAIVSEALKGPCVVVGHSLGSVVAYNVLRAHPDAVARYVTLGSPLGIRSLKRRLPRVEMPRTTGSWHNARDPEDVVALFPLDARNFTTDPAIRNHDEVDNGTDNQHGIVGYLPDPWVARSIHEALIGSVTP